MSKVNEHDDSKSGVLEAKILAYGKTFPLRVGGQTIALLAPNNEVAERIKARSRHRVLTAAQVERLARLPEDDPRLRELLERDS